MIPSPDKTRVAVLLYPGCIFFGIALLAEELARHLSLRYLTPDGAPHAASNGAMLSADGAYTELEEGDWAAVLVPGGDPDSIIPDGLASAGLQAAAGRGAVIASICGGNLVLAAAGALRGKRATHNYNDDYAPAEAVAFTAPFWLGVEYQLRDVVRDGNIITAMPWAYVEYAATALMALGLIDAAESEAFCLAHGPRLGQERKPS